MAARKTILVVSGNKGGVGKSLFCKALASAFEMRGELYSVLDGDGRTGDVFSAFDRKVPARLGDFRELRPESHTCSFDGAYEQMLHQLLRCSPHLIINTPDGADRILMKWFDVTLKHTESNNYQFKFIYLMSDRPDGLEILPELAKRFQFLYPVRNLHFGDESLFSVFNQDYGDRFHGIFDFRPLRGQEVRMLFDAKTFPFAAVNRHVFGFHALSRSRLLNWQKGFNEDFLPLLDDDEFPNLVHGAWSVVGQ